MAEATILPGVLLSGFFSKANDQEGVIADAVERVASQGFYGGIEIAGVASARDRVRIRQEVEANGLRLMYWLSLVIYKEQLNLASLDETARKRAVAGLVQLLPSAAECGASTVGVLSGADPGPENREQATDALYRSLTELLSVLQPYPGIRLLLEPIDRGAHKNMLIGPTEEAVALTRRVRASFPNFGLSWDAAHVALCGEDLIESLRQSRDCVDQVHLSNAILDRQSPSFGDWHMPPGSPGFLTEDVAASILAEVAAWERPIMVSVEASPESGSDPWALEQQCRTFLVSALDRV